VANFDWSQLSDVGAWSGGVGIEDLRRLVNFWQCDFGWRNVERRLNLLPNFFIEIIQADGKEFARGGDEIVVDSKREISRITTLAPFAKEPH
jgi:hypothetical protein